MKQIEIMSVNIEKEERFINFRCYNYIHGSPEESTEKLLEKNNSMKWLNMIKYINTIVLFLCTIKKWTKYIEVFLKNIPLTVVCF